MKRLRRTGSADTMWAPHLVRHPEPCDPRYDPPASDPDWLGEALKYARNPIEEDILRGVIPLSLKGWMHGSVKVMREARDRGERDKGDAQWVSTKDLRGKLLEFLQFLSVKAQIPMAVAVRNRREFVLVLGWRPEDLEPEWSPGVITRRYPSLQWCPIGISGRECGHPGRSGSQVIVTKTGPKFFNTFRGLAVLLRTPDTERRLRRRA